MQAMASQHKDFLLHVPPDIRTEPLAMAAEDLAIKSTPEGATPDLTDATRHLLARLGDRHIVLVGLMGAGKTSVGKRLAQKLSLPFIDSDHAIEEAAGMSIPDIFKERGEAEFRSGERRVIARLLSEPQQVIATGGGAYMDAETRLKIRGRSISLWLKADLHVLMKRVQRRADRPLLANADPEATMRDLITRRYPIYAESDVTIHSGDQSHDVMVQAVIEALNQHLDGEAQS
ncbi:MAG: shikimate kinase [Rhabdaerophilum sp.]